MRGEVDRVVQLPVPAPGQAVTDHLAAGCFDRGGAGVAGMMVRAGEPPDIADVSQDLRREPVADPHDLGQGRARRGDRGGAAATVLGDRLVETSDVGEQVAGHLRAFGLDRVAGTDLGEQGVGLGGAQVQG